MRLFTFSISLLVSKGNSVFVDGDFIPYRDQWAYLSSVKKINETAVDSLIETLCAKSELGELYKEDQPDKPWEIRLPKTDSELFPQSLEVVLANTLYIPKRGVSQSGLNRLKRLACFKDPDFYKAQAMTIYKYSISEAKRSGEIDEYLQSKPRSSAPTASTE